MEKKKKQRLFGGKSASIRKHQSLARKRNFDGLYKAIVYMSSEPAGNVDRFGMFDAEIKNPGPFSNVLACPRILIRLEHETFYREIELRNKTLPDFREMIGNMFGKKVVRLFLVRENKPEVKILIDRNNWAQIANQPDVAINVEFECSYIG